MGMWPTATLTYGYDIDLSETSLADSDEPDWDATNLLGEAGLPDHIGVHQDGSDAHGGLRLTAVNFSASGWTEKGVRDSLELPENWETDLRRAAEILGVDLADTKPYWLLTGEFN